MLTNFLKIAIISLTFVALICCISMAKGQMIHDQMPANMTCGHIGYSSPVIQEIAVNEDTNSALFFLNWSRNESDLQFTLTSPGSEKIPPGKDYLQHERGNWYEFYLLRNPEQGIWSLEITSENRSDGENKYCLLVELVNNNTQKDKRAEITAPSGNTAGAI